MPSKKSTKKNHEESSQYEVGPHEFVKKELDTGHSTVDTGPQASEKKPKKAKATKKKVKKKKTEATSESGLPEPQTPIEFLDGNDQPIAIDQKKIDEQLTEIYENTDGSMPDMSTIEKRHRGRFIRALFTLIFACAFLGGVAWLGFFVIQPQSGFSEEDVVLSISGEEDIAIGQEVRYRIRYRNAQNVPLAQAVLQVRYPEGFVFRDSSIESTKETNDEWRLGTIKGHDSGYIDIFGTMYGDVGKRQSFRAFLNYLPSNFSSEFQKVATVATEMTRSLVSVSIQGPEDIAVGAEGTYTFTIIKDGNEPVGSLALELEEGAFRATASEPESDQFHEARWTLDSTSDESTVTITGVFSAEENETRVPVAVRVVGWKDDKNRTGDGYVYATSSLDVSVLRTELGAHLVINGSSADFDVQPGERLNNSISIKNVGESTFRSARVRLVFETPSADNQSMLYWQDILDEAEGDIVGEQLNADRRRGYITWDAGDLSELSRIEPGESILLDLSIPVKTMDQTDLRKFGNGDITAFVEVRYDVDDTQETLTTEPIRMTVNSDVALNVTDDIREDAQEKELHIVTWDITNQFHELENMELIADVYGDVQWDESLLQMPEGELLWDANEKKIRWRLERMPLDVEQISLQFGLLLNAKNPSQTQLTSKPQLTATDTITGRQLVKIGSEIILNGGAE